MVNLLHSQGNVESTVFLTASPDTIFLHYKSHFCWVIDFNPHKRNAKWAEGATLAGTVTANEQFIIIGLSRKK